MPRTRSFVLSILFALILALIIHRMGFGAAVATGAVYGLVLYLVNFYGMTAIFPWFAMARNWVSIFAHILFGFIVAWAYKKLQARAAASISGARRDSLAAD